MGAFVLFVIGTCACARWNAYKHKKLYGPATPSKAKRLGPEYSPPKGGSAIMNPVYGKGDATDDNSPSPESSPLVWLHIL